jgi:trehalose 6-phosphate phosphatase
MEEFDRLAEAYRSGRSLALLFDFDGTLAPLVTHPDLATCPPETLGVLAALAQLPRILVGVISGRALADLKTKISLPNLVYAGTSGLEMELGDRLLVHPEAARYTPALAAAEEVAALTIRQFPGAWIERKPLSFAVHYRQVRRDEIALCTQCLASKLARFSGVLECIDGSLAMELLPAIGWAKGEALSAIIAHHGQDAIPLYAGNDVRDAGPMLLAATGGGVAVGVGPEAPCEAQYQLGDVESLTEHLAHFVARLQGS